MALIFVVICTSEAKNDESFVVSNNADSLAARSDERTQRFYDSLESKSTRRRLPRFLYNSLLIKSRKDTLSGTKVVDESAQFDKYAGKIIGEIKIEPSNVFDTERNGLERFANKIHVVTRERTLRRDMLFRSGDKVDPELLVNNEQFIKARNFIYDAKITLEPNPDDSTRVDVVLRTQDSWTMSVDAAINLSGKSMIELYDANVLGLGNKLSVRTNFNWSNGNYGGNMVKYYTPNIFGSFFTGDLIAGRNFSSSDLGLKIKKEFIKPTDYSLGAEYADTRRPYYMLYADSSVNVESRQNNLWGGKSFYIKKLRSSIYFSATYNRMRFDVRPDVSETFNPRFHDGKQVLGAVGLYKEKFYTTNLIFGYGVKEYIPAGYKIELMTGYRWGEFASDIYMGLEYTAGGFSKIGYLMGSVAIGSYYNDAANDWKQSTLNVQLRYFSNLIVSGRSRIRQFVNISYVKGWHRLDGSDELISFDSNRGLRGFNDYATGLNRAMLSSETVVFTPLKPLDLKMTFFGYADMGLIGNEVDIFKNKFFSTFGVGVRIKNERLVFSTIELRLGIAVGKGGVLKNDIFNISNRYTMEKYRYLPRNVEPIPYR